jgi:hypothetical protein
VTVIARFLDPQGELSLPLPLSLSPLFAVRVPALLPGGPPWRGPMARPPGAAPWRDLGAAPLAWPRRGTGGSPLRVAPAARPGVASARDPCEARASLTRAAPTRAVINFLF